MSDSPYEKVYGYQNSTCYDCEKEFPLECLMAADHYLIVLICRDCANYRGEMEK